MTLEQIEKICDKQGFWVNKDDNMFGNGKPGWEIGQMSSCGEDWFETLEADDVDTLIASLERRIDNWDSEEEAMPYIEMRGQNGVPSSIRDLLDDADWKEEQLKDLLDAIKEAPDEEDELDESKKVTEWIEDDEDEFGKIKRTKWYEIATDNGFEDKRFDDEEKAVEYARKLDGDVEIYVTGSEKYTSGKYKGISEPLDSVLLWQRKDGKEKIVGNTNIKLEKSKKVTEAPEDDIDLENSDDVNKLADEVEPTAVDELIEEWEAKSPLHERVISEIVEDSEGYDGETLKERVLGRLGDIANGLVNGTVGSLIYYSDTVKFFDDYYDDIWDVIQDLVDNGLEPLEAIKEHCDETEILMCSDTVKNWVAWMVYEEIAYMFRNELEDVNE